MEAGTEGCGVVVNGLMVRSRCKLGGCSVTARIGMELFIDRAALVSSVEASRREFVGCIVNNLLFEDFTSLFGLGLTQVVVVHADARHVALVSGEHSSFLFNGSLGSHVVCGGTVEVLGRPLEEFVFSEDLARLRIGMLKLGS